MRIVIDARLYGSKNTGNGRYTANLIESLAKQDSENEYFVLLRSEFYNQINLPKKFKKVLADFGHYSIAEQIRMPFLLNSLKPDIVHFTHFNVPVFYFGNFVVTIHDLIMHKFWGWETTTANPIKYIFFRIGYYVAFAKAVYFSKRIICPTEAVKKDIISFYKINPKKIDVIYEA